MYRKLRLIIGVATVFCCAGQSVAQVQSDKKLPLDAFASLPAMTQATVPLDGSKLAIVRATSKDGDYIVEIRLTNDLSAEPVRLGASRMEITSVSWLNNDKLLGN